MSSTDLPSGPPWSLDVVADVQAGVYPPDVTQRLRALIAEDPEAAAILSALDAVVDDLSLLPAPVMPAEYASRLDAALMAESRARDAAAGDTPAATVAPLRPVAAVDRPEAPALPTGGGSGPLPPSALPPGVSDLDRARRRRQGWFAGIGAVAAAAVIGTVVVLSLPGDTSGTGTVGNADLQAGQQAPVSLLQYFSVLDNGISRPVQVADNAGCLESLDVDAASVLGMAEGTVDGQDVLLIVTTDLGDAPADATRVRVLIVAAGCSADGAEVVRETLNDR